MGGECVQALTLTERLLARAAPGLAAVGDREVAEELFHRVRCSGGPRASEARTCGVVSGLVSTTATG